ncbi:hypothetical protein P152DRAFT_459393 [Eremomyces bilateralis CBS 781.70]|uniref:Small ribosomal subunit protein uS9m n=1 Tax=Eremomyces bilateralis CBS 781.70 TaxID=1392243 RepID=A0A6G1G074_9PEZI|nr:uncharacterized protein P152DRAFT_459393 [Eremomyces bilateralis CBS 781.70]KAF1811454.1 hypothetical protein P152DRAFT_459393 [Eremomyces bilateralis CBS 781.70]
MDALRLPVRLKRPFCAALPKSRAVHLHRNGSTTLPFGETVRSVSTSTSELQTSIGTPLVPYRNEEGGYTLPREARVRIVPASPSYFTGRPNFTDHLLSLQDLLRRNELLPTVPPGQAPRTAWRTLTEYKEGVSEPVKSAGYTKILSILNRLNHINPSLMPSEVREVIETYKRKVSPFDNVPNPHALDSWGRGLGVGRRKTASARAWVVEGEGEVIVNGKSLSEMFGRIHDRESAVFALKATERLDRYNIWALVKGGGTTGQAEALTLAVAKALLIHEPGLKPALRRAGVITRDARKVERKKPGKLKARKMPAWVKR